MTDSTASSELGEQAVRRLRALAEGNGIEPGSIKLMQSDAQTYTLEAVMYFTPLCDVQNKRYPGPPSGRAIMFQDAAALAAEVARRREAFRGRSDWIPDVQTELQNAPGQGWGLDGANVTLNKLNIVLAACSPCTQCQGNRMITCTQCQGTGSSVCAQCRGQGQEICVGCNGSGQNPQLPDQPCIICRGASRMVCRVCHGNGQAACPACGGRRGIPCSACKATGKITEEVSLTFGATTRFDLKSAGLPSGLRRGLDRLGLPNLAKGHADIEIIEPKKEPEEEADAGPLEEDSAPKPKAPQPTLHYRAQMPFAELKVDFGGKKAIVGVFGKRNVMIDVPPFLDEALKPWRTKLQLAAKGNGAISEAIKARAIHDALGLELQGKGTAKELRRLYPFGLSPKAAEEIMVMMRLALKKGTLRVRTAVAIVCGLIGAGFFGGCYFTSLSTYILPQPRWLGLAFDLLPPVLAIVFGWALLNFATRFFLQRDFPNMKIAHRQTVGKTGMTMTVGLLILWLVILILSPARPVWLPLHF